MAMHGRQVILAAAVCLMSAGAGAGAGAASAQTPLSCSSAPQSVCEDPELAALENERAALVAQLSAADPGHAALANEETWAAGLGACGEDAACYRTAYLNHNETLRQAAGALTGEAAAPETPLEAPAEAPTVEEQTALDEAQAERLRRAAEESRNNTPPRRGEAVYVPVGLPGWGFFTMFGLALFGWWWLSAAIKRNRQVLRAEEARLRAWRR